LWDDLGRSNWAADIVRETFIRADVDNLAQKYAISSLADWHLIIDKQRKQKLPFASRFSQLGGLARVLSVLYPYHPWKFPLPTSTLLEGITVVDRTSSSLTHLQGALVVVVAGPPAKHARSTSSA